MCVCWRVCAYMFAKFTWGKIRRSRRKKNIYDFFVSLFLKPYAHVLYVQQLVRLSILFCKKHVVLIQKNLFLLQRCYYIIIIYHHDHRHLNSVIVIITIEIENVAYTYVCAVRPIGSNVRNRMQHRKNNWVYKSLAS